MLTAAPSAPHRPVGAPHHPESALQTIPSQSEPHRANFNGDLGRRSPAAPPNTAWPTTPIVTAKASAIYSRCEICRHVARQPLMTGHAEPNDLDGLVRRWGPRVFVDQAVPTNCHSTYITSRGVSRCTLSRRPRSVLTCGHGKGTTWNKHHTHESGLD